MSSLRRRPETRFEQHLAHRCRGDADADALELADDPLVSPVRVLSGETQDQLTERALKRRSPRFPMCVRPAARDKLAMPAQQCVRFHREVPPSRPRHCATERSEQRPISTGQPRPASPPAQHGHLMTQEQDLELLRATGPRQQPHQREQVPRHQINERPEQAALLDRRQAPGT